MAGEKQKNVNGAQPGVGQSNDPLPPRAVARALVMLVIAVAAMCMLVRFL